MMEQANYLLEGYRVNTPKIKLRIFCRDMAVYALSTWSKKQVSWIQEDSGFASMLMMHVLKMLLVFLMGWKSALVLSIWDGRKIITQLVWNKLHSWVRMKNKSFLKNWELFWLIAHKL